MCTHIMEGLFYFGLGEELNEFLLFLLVVFAGVRSEEVKVRPDLGFCDGLVELLVVVVVLLGEDGEFEVVEELGENGFAVDHSDLSHF